VLWRRGFFIAVEFPFFGVGLQQPWFGLLSGLAADNDLVALQFTFAVERFLQ